MGNGSDGEVVIKAVATAGDADRTMASLEKRLDDLANKVEVGNSKAKQAAIAAKEAAKAKEKAEVEAAKKIRDAERQLQADVREERRRTEREGERNRRKSERDESESRRNKERATREAERQKQADAREAARIKSQLEREATREAKQAERDRQRDASNAARERKRIALDESREKKRIKREEARELKRIELETTRASERMQAWISGVVGVTAAYQGVSAIISTIIGQNEKLIAQSDELGNKQDALQRKFAIQAGMTAIESKPLQESIKREAERAGVLPEVASEGATQLVSSGFTPQQASGPALRQILEGMVASGDTGGDVGQFALNATQFMSGAGMGKTAANLGKVMQSMYSSKKEGNFQAGDMEQIAPSIQGFITQGGSFEEAMAGFNTMKESTNREKAATGFKIMVERLMGAKASTKRTKQLAKLDLKPEQVDLVGESLGDVGALLNERIEKLPKPDRQPFLQQFFGTETAAPIQGFLNKQARYKEFLSKQGDVQGYQQAVETGQSGRDALARKQAAEKQNQTAGFENDVTAILNELEMLTIKKGSGIARSPPLSPNVAWTNRAVAERMRNFSSSPRFLGSMQGTGERFEEAVLSVRQKKRERLKAADPASQADLDRITGDTPGERPEIPIAADVPPAPPVGEKPVLPAADPNAPKSNFPFLPPEERDRANRERQAKFRGEKPFVPFVPAPESSDFTTDIDDETTDEHGDDQAGLSRGSRLADELSRQTAEVSTQTGLMRQMVSLLTERQATAVKDPPRRARAVNASETA